VYVCVCASVLKEFLLILVLCGALAPFVTDLDISVSASDTVSFLRCVSVLKEFLLILILCSFFTWVFYSVTETQRAT